MLSLRFAFWDVTLWQVVTGPVVGTLALLGVGRVVFAAVAFEFLRRTL